MLRQVVATAFAVLALTSASALAADSGLTFMHFQANGYGAFQDAGGNTFSGQISWNPQYGLSDSLYLRGNLGATLLKSTFDSKFLATNYQVLAGYRLGSFGLEAGGGAQTWFDNGGTAAIVSANVPWSFDKPLLGLFDRVFAGGSMFLLSNTTYEARLGVGISI